MYQSLQIVNIKKNKTFAKRRSIFIHIHIHAHMHAHARTNNNSHADIDRLLMKKFNF